jgi:hypothetical protein
MFSVMMHWFSAAKLDWMRPRRVGNTTGSTPTEPAMAIPSNPTNHTNPTNHDAILDTIAQRELFIEGLFTSDLHAQPDTYPCPAENLRAALQVAFVTGMILASYLPAIPTPASEGGSAPVTMTPVAGPSMWTGRIGSFRFVAQVYGEHPACAAYAIDRSRITKLELRRTDNDRLVYAWDRGLDLLAIDATTQSAVDTLAEQLADLVYGPAKR